MNKEYVQQYVTLEKKHWWFLVRQKIILKFLKKYLPFDADKKLQVLNIGVSGGATSELLAAFGNVVSVETEPFFIEYLRQQQMQVTEASITSLPFNDNSFDLVCAFDVIEHVADDVAAMKEMTRVCKEGGNICITVPTVQALWSNHDVVNGHYRRYSIKRLQHLFVFSQGIKVSKILYFNSLLFLPIFVARKASNIFSKNKKPSQSDFTLLKTTGILSRILKFIFGLEVPMITVIPFPVGVSLISLLKKRSSQAIETIQ